MNPPEKRWRSNGTGYNHQGYITKAIKKYGWDNVFHYTIFQTHYAEAAYEVEKALIALFRSNEREFGYNISSGGEAGA